MGKNYKLVYLMLLFLIPSLYSCQKEEIEEVTLKKEIFLAVAAGHKEDLKGIFEANDYNINLIENFFGEDSLVYWHPKWEKITQRRDSIVTYFIPLIPQLYPIKIDNKDLLITPLGIEKYLVIKETSKVTKFYIATYVSDRVETQNSKFNFNNFTGFVIVKDLENSSSSLISYKNGKRKLERYKTSKNEGGDYTANACITTQVCSWGGSCDSGLTVTYTSGNTEGGGCSYPGGVSGCGDNTSWYLSYSSFETDCSGTYDPGPPPGGGDDGSGGSGGPSGPGGPSNPDDGVLKPALETFTPAEVDEPEPEELNCDQLGNFHDNPRKNLNDFINENYGLTRDAIISQRGDLSITNWHSQPGGPNIRYIVDPQVPGAVIDLRHMLVIGYYGKSVGNSVEMMQWLSLNESGMDHQDYYSNQLGYDFYRDYGAAITYNPTAFLDYLTTFLHSGKRSTINNPAVVNPLCP